MNELKRLDRIAKKYEKDLEISSAEIKSNVDFCIKQIELIIESTKLAIDNTNTRVSIWAECITLVSEIDDANTLFKKIRVKIMECYVNYMYSSSIKYLYNTSKILTRFEKILLRLNQIKYIC